MLQRVVHESGVVSYQSTKLAKRGVPHGFSTRIGGVSSGAYGTLNLGVSSSGPKATPAEGDRRENIVENFRRFAAAVGLPDRDFAKAHQVHGPGVHCVGSANRGVIPEADAIITEQPDIAVSIRIADCVPILISSADGKVVAGVHAGWRGVVSGVVPATLIQLAKEHGIMPGETVAAIGPCIGVEHFEVGHEVADAFVAAGLGGAVVRGEGKPHIDLALAVFEQLIDSGVAVDAIDVGPLCTYANELDFYSHRRDRGVTGRLIAMIGVKK